MFRAVQGHQIDARRLEEDVDGGFEFPVHAGRIGHQAHPLPAKPGELPVTQDLNAGTDLGIDGERA